MIFLFLIAAVVLLDLGLKDTIDEMDQEQFPKELEGSRGWILLYRNHNEGFPFGALKEKNYAYVQNEISEIKKVCGNKILKVIIETCLLTEEEKIKMCEIISRTNADFIKTSTGFSKSGATFDDITLFSNYIGSDVKIKAAGGISSFEDGEKFIALGASRLGTSKLIKIEKSL